MIPQTGRDRNEHFDLIVKCICSILLKNVQRFISKQEKAQN